MTTFVASSRYARHGLKGFQEPESPSACVLTVRDDGSVGGCWYCFSSDPKAECSERSRSESIVQRLPGER